MNKIPSLNKLALLTYSMLIPISSYAQLPTIAENPLIITRYSSFMEGGYRATLHPFTNPYLINQLPYIGHAAMDNYQFYLHSSQGLMIPQLDGFNLNYLSKIFYLPTVAWHQIEVNSNSQGISVFPNRSSFNSHLFNLHSYTEVNNEHNLRQANFTVGDRKSFYLLTNQNYPSGNLQQKIYLSHNKQNWQNLPLSEFNYFPIWSQQDNQQKLVVGGWISALRGSEYNSTFTPIYLSRRPTGLDLAYNIYQSSPFISHHQQLRLFAQYQKTIADDVDLLAGTNLMLNRGLRNSVLFESYQPTNATISIDNTHNKQHTISLYLGLEKNYLLFDGFTNSQLKLVVDRVVSQDKINSSSGDITIDFNRRRFNDVKSQQDFFVDYLYDYKIQQQQLQFKHYWRRNLLAIDLNFSPTKLSYYKTIQEQIIEDHEAARISRKINQNYNFINSDLMLSFNWPNIQPWIKLFNRAQISEDYIINNQHYQEKAALLKTTALQLGSNFQLGDYLTLQLVTEKGNMQQPIANNLQAIPYTNKQAIISAEISPNSQVFLHWMQQQSQISVGNELQHNTYYPQRYLKLNYLKQFSWSWLDKFINHPSLIISLNHHGQINQLKGVKPIEAYTTGELTFKFNSKIGSSLLHNSIQIENLGNRQAVKGCAMDAACMLNHSGRSLTFSSSFLF